MWSCQVFTTWTVLNRYHSQSIQEWHVLRLSLDGVRKEHVCLVRYDVLYGRMLHTCTSERVHKKEYAWWYFSVHEEWGWGMGGGRNVHDLGGGGQLTGSIIIRCGVDAYGCSIARESTQPQYRYMYSGVTLIRLCGMNICIDCVHTNVVVKIMPL